MIVNIQIGGIDAAKFVASREQVKLHALGANWAMVDDRSIEKEIFNCPWQEHDKRKARTEEIQRDALTWANGASYPVWEEDPNWIYSHCEVLAKDWNHQPDLVGVTKHLGNQEKDSIEIKVFFKGNVAIQIIKAVECLDPFMEIRWVLTDGDVGHLKGHPKSSVEVLVSEVSKMFPILGTFDKGLAVDQLDDFGPSLNFYINREGEKRRELSIPLIFK